MHNPLFIGWASEADQDLGPARGFRLRRPKTGAGIQALSYTTDELVALAAEAEKLTELVNRMWGVLLIGTTFEKNFTRLEDATWLAEPPDQ